MGLSRLEILYVLPTPLLYVSGGGIDRFIGAEGLTVDEGGAALIRTRNLNTSGILDFIRRHRQQGVAVEKYSYEYRHQPPLLRLQVRTII